MKKYPKIYSMATINSDQGLTSICTQGGNGPIERYVLYDPTMGMPPMYYKNILSQAKESIRIMDPHAFEHDAINVFEAVCNENIHLEVFTSGYDEDKIVSVADDINEILKKNITQFKITIYSYKKNRVPSEHRINLWHDRYLIVDDSDFYLIGSSIDAQVTSSVCHGICQLIEDGDKNEVFKLFKKYRDYYNRIRAYKTTKTGR